MSERVWLRLDGVKQAVTLEDGWYYTSVDLNRIDEIIEMASGRPLRVARAEPAEHEVHDRRYRLEEG
jgi:hypothetical protein